MPINRLNHAVLFVRDADAAAEFYRRAFGFEELSRPPGMRAAFMRSPTGGNHHDLGLFEVGAAAPRPPRGSVGLYHLAWEVGTIEDLATAAKALSGDDRHARVARRYGRHVVRDTRGLVPLDEEPLHGPDRQRPIDVAAPASTFAGR